MSVNHRIEELVNTYSDGNVSKFAKRIGFAHTTIASVIPGSKRESKPGFDVLAKIVETFPEVSSDWLLMGKGDMQRGNHSEVSGDNNTAYQWNNAKSMKVTNGKDSKCEQDLAVAQKEIEGLREQIKEYKDQIAFLKSLLPK